MSTTKGKQILSKRRVVAMERLAEHRRKYRRPRFKLVLNLESGRREVRLTSVQCVELLAIGLEPVVVSEEFVFNVREV